MLSLGSSFVLVAGETDSNVPEIALLLWDIQYGVLLHQHMLPIPSLVEVDGVSHAPFVPLQLVPATSIHALLLISPSRFPRGASSPGNLRHSVLVVPYSVPPFSTIASALGKASSASVWLVSEKPQRDSGSKIEGILQAVQNAVEEEKPEEADSIFFAYVNAESSRRAKQKGKQPQGQAEVGDLDISNTFTHNVTTRLVQSLLPADAKAKTPYSPKIIRYLLEHDLVSNSMLSGGHLAALCFRSDWVCAVSVKGLSERDSSLIAQESMRMCFSHVANIPELDLMRTLGVVIKSRPPPSDDAMAVDNGADSTQTVISYFSFLAGCMTYPSSPTPLRTALRTVFYEGTDLTILLRVIVDWLDEVVEKDVDLCFGEVAENEHGVPIVKQQQLKHTHLDRIMEQPPPLENVRRTLIQYFA